MTTATQAEQSTEEHTATANYTYAESLKRETDSYIKVPKSLNCGVNSYAVLVSGDCLNPDFRHGDTLLVDPDQEPVVGDFVGIWWKGGRKPHVKRLVLALPPVSMRGLKGHVPLLVVEQFNPPKQLSAPWGEVDRVHKVLGKLTNTSTGSSI